MYKNLLLFLSFIVSILLFFTIPRSVLAQQNVYRCRVQGTSCVFLAGSANCDTGYAAGNSCSVLSLDPSSSIYCANFAPQCASDPNYGREGEPCRANNVCDTGFTCAAGGTCTSGTQPPPGGGGSGGGITANINCAGGSLGQNIDTAIGCIDISDTNALIGFFLRWGLGLAGGIAVFMIILAGFKITTSSGDPKRLQAGQELLTSAIAGVILLVFSIFILQVVGVNILGLNLGQ